MGRERGEGGKEREGREGRRETLEERWGWEISSLFTRMDFKE